MALSLIRVTAQNASEASHIYAAAWKVAYRGIVPQAYLDALSPERWTPLLGNGNHIDLALEQEGKMVATCSICPARDAAMTGWGEIMSLYVLPECFRRGYGRRLIAAAQQELHCQGFAQQYLWVLEDNHRARAFYEAVGFMPNGRRSTFSVGGTELTELCYVHRP